MRNAKVTVDCSHLQVRGEAQARDKIGVINIYIILNVMRLGRIIDSEHWGSPCREVGKKENPTGKLWKLRHREHGSLELSEPLGS